MTHAAYTQLIHVKRWADLGLYEAIGNNLDRLTNEDSFLETLAASAREVDDWYAAYVAGLGESVFEEPIDFVFTSGKPARMKRGEIILHVCMHGTYHRGNAGAVLQLSGLTPSRDSVTDFLEQ